jgi:hypothetical protein
MSEQSALRFEMYKLYLETAERVSDRRASANAWMLSVNSAIVGLSSYLAPVEHTAGGTPGRIWSAAIPVAGILVCIAWAALLTSYSKLNGAKFKVLHELEAELPSALFTLERQFYRQTRRRSLSRLELAVPWSFAALYAGLIAATMALPPA